MDGLMESALWIVIPGAYLLDLIAGDPRWLPHPVVGMGTAITRLEPWFRRNIRKPVAAGALFAAFLVTGVWALTWAVVALAEAVHPWVGIGVQIVGLFFCLSGKSLAQAASHVGEELKNYGLDRGRQAVSMIVGREVRHLDRTGVVKAAVETVAENFVDGVLSPLFFAVIGGVPLAMAYKMVNTLDSMVGYTNETYLYFGRASARLDDIANYIPARLSLLIIALGTGLLNRRRGLRAMMTGFREGRRHKSPNSGYPEASFAGALKVRLGGPNYYHGILVEKPFIGFRFQDPGPETIPMACDLMLLSTLLSVAGATVLAWWI